MPPRLFPYLMVFKMKFTKKEREMEALSLEDSGLSAEEIEAYLDFYDNIWGEGKPRKKTMVINSGKKKVV